MLLQTWERDGKIRGREGGGGVIFDFMHSLTHDCLQKLFSRVLTALTNLQRPRH